MTAYEETMKYKSGKLVVPGEELCVIEEFAPGDGAYEKNGKVYSSRTGVALYDFITRKVQVLSTYDKMSLAPKVGLIVYGQVYTVHDEIANVKITEIEGHKKLSGTFSGVLHVSQVSRSYIKKMDDAVKPGDIIRAKVLTSWNPYQLTTRHSTLGVVLALCSKCGSLLWKSKSGKLVCKKCGNVEERKLSSKYTLKLRS